MAARNSLSLIAALAMTTGLGFLPSGAYAVQQPKVPVLKINPTKPPHPNTKVHGHVSKLPKPDGIAVGRLKQCTTTAIATVEDVNNHCSESVGDVKTYKGTGFTLTLWGQRMIIDPESQALVDCAVTTCSIVALTSQTLQEVPPHVILAVPFKTLPN